MKIDELLIAVERIKQCFVRQQLNNKIENKNCIPCGIISYSEKKEFQVVYDEFIISKRELLLCIEQYIKKELSDSKVEQN